MLPASGVAGEAAVHAGASSTLGAVSAAAAAAAAASIVGLSASAAGTTASWRSLESTAHKELLSAEVVDTAFFDDGATETTTSTRSADPHGGGDEALTDETDTDGEVDVS